MQLIVAIVVGSITNMWAALTSPLAIVLAEEAAASQIRCSGRWYRS